MGIQTRRGLSTLAVIAAMSSSPSAAGLLQGPRPFDSRSLAQGGQNPLASITDLRCRFSVTTSVLWKDGKPEIGTEATESEVTISDIDIQDGTAEVSGPQGRRFATTVLSDGSLYFMESTRGALDVTTVFATESSPGKLKAVRAQYAYVFLTVPPFVPDPTVTHSYGECEPSAGV